MTIETNLAIQSYGAMRRSLAAGTGGDGGEAAGLSFSDALTQAARMMEQSLREAEAASTAAATGQGDVQTLVEALSKTELALETAVTVRDRVVEAYQEILRMPV